MLIGKYLDTFFKEYTGYANYLWHEITHPGLQNYFYWLLAVSAFFFALEYFNPWRKEQQTFRKDFWLDFFYMFFNFFLFSLIIYNAASSVVVDLFNDFLGLFGIKNLVAIQVKALPFAAYMLIGFVVRDFVQWNVHRLLHRSPFLWKYHQVHHSVEQMGFAAHLRYHWMENIVYRSLEYLPLAMLGIDLGDFFIIHIFTLTVGHYNHSNISIPGQITAGVLGGLIALFISAQYSMTVLPSICLFLTLTVVAAFLIGPYMKYIFNSPEMHIWHHAYNLPEERKYGVNFGLTLAIWDYLFGTAHIPHNGRDIRLGFPGVEDFPEGFVQQSLHGTPLSKD